MDRIGQLFLKALRASLENRKLIQNEAVSESEWTAVLKLAGQHHVLPMVFEAVRGTAALSLGAPTMAAYRQEALRTVFLQAARTEEFKKLYKYLTDTGLKPCVVKGIVCRGLYPNADARMSADEDLLVNERDFAKAHELLLQYGLFPEGDEDPATACEIGYRGEKSVLYIELHKTLFPPDSKAYGDLNSLFAGVEDRLIRTETCGLELWTMPAADNLLYLLLHSFKHFLHSGFGLRQVCDIVLFAQRFGKDIDWDLLLGKLSSVRAEGFTAAVFAIGEKYLGFDSAAAGMSSAWMNMKVDEQPMLEDLLASGVFGQDLNRRHSSNITLDAVAAEKQGRRSGGVLSAVFLPYSSMAEKFEYVNKYPFLLPVGWVHRVIKYKTENTGHEASESLRLGRERTELLAKYGVIDSKKSRKSSAPAAIAAFAVLAAAGICANSGLWLAAAVLLIAAAIAMLVTRKCR